MVRKKLRRVDCARGKKRFPQTTVLVALALLAAACAGPGAPTEEKPAAKQVKKKDRLFLMGVGMLRLNWAEVEGDAVRFRYSDLGLPADLSTRERASFTLDGTLGNESWKVGGFLNYDPENRITEPPLEFLFTARTKSTYFSVGDYRTGVFADSIFSRFTHPFRGVVAGIQSPRVQIEALAGVSRGETGVDELPLDAGSGPYYFRDSPILRGSEVLFLVSRSAADPSVEINRTTLVRNKDYQIDYDRGAVIFTRPAYPFDDLGNPVYLLASYQFESLAGRFTRMLGGIRASVRPLRPLTLHVSYLADGDRELSIGDAWDSRRGILTLGANLDTPAVQVMGEYAAGNAPAIETRDAWFAGARVSLPGHFTLMGHGWSVDADFPVFANRQLEYGYSLFQIFPSFAERYIFLSPFQFTRNLGAELYPFLQTNIGASETEAHGMLEWDKGPTRISGGYGYREGESDSLQRRQWYASLFHNGEATRYWAKLGLTGVRDADAGVTDTRQTDTLLGLRQRVGQGPRGEWFFQLDYQGIDSHDLLDLTLDNRRHVFSFMGEYLTGSEGVFAGYRREVLNQEEGERLHAADVYEAGIRRRVYKGFFLDSRFRLEEIDEPDGASTNRIVSLGAGFETRRFRAMARYEFQLNRDGENEGRRHLWSIFLYGSPLDRMSLSLRYYSQKGEDDAPLSLNERSEEQLNLRLLWRPSDALHIYSQWRYDTNIELYPPLDRTKSNTLAAVQGVKLRVTRKLEFLATWKMLKVWGIIENRKSTAAVELGYLLWRHFRLGLGAEYIDFRDSLNPESDYRSTVGYLKLVALF